MIVDVVVVYNIIVEDMVVVIVANVVETTFVVVDVGWIRLMVLNVVAVVVLNVVVVVVLSVVVVVVKLLSDQWSLTVQLGENIYHETVVVLDGLLVRGTLVVLDSMLVVVHVVEVEGCVVLVVKVTPDLRIHLTSFPAHAQWTLNKALHQFIFFLDNLDGDFCEPWHMLVLGAPGQTQFCKTSVHILVSRTP